LARICFDCGESFEGDGVLCLSCKTERLERAKTNKHRNTRTHLLLDQLMTALGVIVALLTM